MTGTVGRDDSDGELMAVSGIVRETTIGPCRLLLGDCREILPLLRLPDVLIADPPYGESHASNRRGRFNGETICGDESTDVRDFVLNWWGGRPAAVFGKWSVTKYGKPRGVVVWDKGPASGMGDLSFPFKPSWEDIAFYGRGWTGTRDEGVIRGHTVVTWSGGEGQRQHPNEKPVSLLELIIEKGPEFKTVLDPFMGSGTTGVACIRQERQFIGIEREPKYFDIAVQRIERAWQLKCSELPFDEPPRLKQRELLEINT